MAQYGRQTDEFGNPIRQTHDEYGNPIHRPGGDTYQTTDPYGITTGTTGAYQTDPYKTTGTAGAYATDPTGTTGAYGTQGGGIAPGTTDIGLAGGGQHRRSGSSSSSSSEDDGFGGRRKKGLKEKIKEKIPGTGSHADQQTRATATTTTTPVHHEKKGMKEKIKEKLPGHHNH